MAPQDISRSIFDPRKQYSGVRMQQGRVLLDDDWNEGQRIADEEMRRTRVDVIGPAGSPDEGFRVENPRLAGGQIDFDLAAGSFYLGGLRLELFQAQSYRSQQDSLQSPPTTSAPAGARFDLAVLQLFRQPVSAVEDAELFEVALGGPDTTTRIRNMWRVLLWEDVGATTCEEAWQQVLIKLQSAGLGQLNSENQLVTDAILSVSFADSGAQLVGTPDDLCAPDTVGGYLGAENQAIRVQLVDDSHFTWGFDNAAPLYRVQVAADRQTITLLTDPKDQAHWPLAGQVVEILPWSALLPNNEKVADVAGHLTLVTASYNPDTGELSVADAVPSAGFDDWKTRADAAQLGATGEYFFLRVWNRASDQQSPPAIPFTAGTGVALGFTGLAVTFAGSQFRPADFWVIAARPETPHRVTPWQLESGRPPHGRQIYMTPLALIRWPGAGADSPDVDDCRPRFRPLTEQEICCSYTVGDGKSSHGDFDSIEEAIERLPASGGAICLLPGLHEANVTLRARANIRVSGCGGSSRVVPRPDQRQSPIFHIIGGRDIVLEQMDLVTLEGAAVVAHGDEKVPVRRLQVQHNRFLAYANAVHVLHADGVTVSHNVIRMLDKEGGDVAIYALADHVNIECNDIGVAPPELAPPVDEPDDDEPPDEPVPTDPCADPEKFYANRAYFAVYVAHVWSIQLLSFAPKTPFNTLGGIQIGSGSRLVRIAQNQISGGAGNGITLGSDFDLADLAAPEESAAEPGGDFVLEPSGDVLWGRLVQDQTPVSGATLVFTGSSETLTAITDEAGQFVEKAQDDAYQVALADAKYRLVGVSSFDQDEFGRFHELRVERVAPAADLLHVLDFIYEVSIQENEIAHMGESGIGIPVVDLETVAEALDKQGVKARHPAQLQAVAVPVLLFGALVGFVVELRIEGNHIFACLRNGFDRESRNPAARLRGVGGISLGMCERLAIRSNRIEQNGVQHDGPVHGVFVIYANQADISHNFVLDNGPDEPGEGQLSAPGGVALFIAAVSNSLLAPDDDGEFGRADRQAVRFHDNIVHQPVGRALTITLGLGPISVADNQLSTDFAVAVSSLGRTLGRSKGIAAAGAPTSWAASNVLAGVAPLLGLAQGAGAVLILDLGASLALMGITASRGAERAALSSRKLRLPTGGVLFNDNQVRLGAAGQSLVSQAIFTLDDISYSDNQAYVYAGDALGANALLYALTSLRAIGNRLQEPRVGLQRTRFSLVSLALGLNSTTLNQGDHCILAQGGRVLDSGNFALFASDDECAERAKALAFSLGRLSGGKYAAYQGVRSMQKTEFGRAQGETTDSAQALLFQFDGLYSGALGQLRMVQVGAHSLLQREEERLVRVAGVQDARVQQVQLRRAELFQTTQALRASMGEAQISVPEMQPDEVLVHGRVLDERQQGIRGLRVYVADAQGKVIEAAGVAETDDSGYYALRVKAGSISADATAGATLTIATNRERVILQETARLDLAAGAATPVEFRVNRLRLSGLAGRREPGRSKESPEEPWIVFGQVTDAEENPMPGLMVNAYDRDRRYDDKLGSALTDEQGRYTVTYGARDFREGAEPGADLYVTVIDVRGQLLFTSENAIRANAGRREEVNIRLESGKDA